MTTSTPGQAAQALHLKAWNQIPWLLAGGASATEHAEFARHADGCEACRAELDFQRQVQAALHASALPAHHAEPALRRLQARIAIEDSVAPRLLPPPRAVHTTRASGWTRAWAGVALLQAAGLVLLGSLWWSRGDADNYRTLTNPPPPSTAAAATVRLVLSPAVSAAQLQALLQRHRLAAVEISADGASFGVRSTDAATASDTVVSALRNEPFVLLAEPIARPAR